MNGADAAERANPIPSIRLLRIERFRGIQKLEWAPAPGLNVIVGPGDCCKSTILEAIATLLSPAPNINVSEFDYYDRKVIDGFEIEAVIAVGDAEILRHDKFPLPPLRGWKEGQLTDLPDEDGAEAVIVCRLTGTSDQEAIYEIVGVDEDARVPLSRSLRQRIGLLRLGVSDRWDRDLRLVMGGALDRYMEGQQLRVSILQAILNTPIHDHLGEQSKEALGQIGEQFSTRGLPTPVRLGLVGTPGVSLAASVGLMVGETDESALPLPAWGTGTRRLATLELASIATDRVSLAVVDEPESGLEPYRQRAFLADLNQEGHRQSFVTTHAPAALSASAALGGVISRVNRSSRPEENVCGAAPIAEAQLAPVDGDAEPDEMVLIHNLVALEGKEIAELVGRRSEAILARLPVLCEGITEEGFITRLLEFRFGNGFPVRGIFCVDCVGHDRTVAISKALLDAGFQIGVVADDENRKEGSWQEISNQAAVLRWDDGANLEKAIICCLPNDVLPLVIRWPEEFGGREARHCLPELRAELGEDDKERSAEQLLEAHGREAFVTALCSAACPPRRGNRKQTGWFKSFDGGYLLANKLLSLDPEPKAVYDKVKEFLNEVALATDI